jgi:hypothetical protein
MWFSRKVLIHPQHPPVKWNLSGIIVEQSTENSNLAAKKGLGRPGDEKICSCIDKKNTKYKISTFFFEKNVLILYSIETVPEVASQFLFWLFFSVISRFSLDDHI